MGASERLEKWFSRGLAATARGRAHILAQVAEAEANGEIEIFARMLERVGDPKLRKMIARHQADELEHERLFRECLARTGFADLEVPADLKIIERLDRASGGMLSRAPADDRGVMETYLMLQVIEERAIRQFAIMADAFRAVDPESCAVFERVSRDEERHLKYCHAIARRYAPDQKTHDETLSNLRALELGAYQENSAANMEHVFAHRIFNPPAPVKWLLRTLHPLAIRQPNASEERMAA